MADEVQMLRIAAANAPKGRRLAATYELAYVETKKWNSEASNQHKP
jgi:hypothetical protein